MLFIMYQNEGYVVMEKTYSCVSEFLNKIKSKSKSETDINEDSYILVAEVNNRPIWFGKDAKSLIDFLKEF